MSATVVEVGSDLVLPEAWAGMVAADGTIVAAIDGRPPVRCSVTRARRGAPMKVRPL